MLSQFYIFSTPTTEPHPLDFRDVGKPLACACLGTAIIVNVIGAARFHRAQDALLNGKALVGGADLMLVGALIGMVSVSRFPCWISHSQRLLTTSTACFSLPGHRHHCIGIAYPKSHYRRPLPQGQLYVTIRFTLTQQPRVRCNHIIRGRYPGSISGVWGSGVGQRGVDELRFAYVG